MRRRRMGARMRCVISSELNCLLADTVSQWTPATVISLFPISPASAAKDAILDSLDDLRATIARLMPSDDPAESTSSKPTPSAASRIPPEEVARLQDTIKKLQAQIGTPLSLPFLNPHSHWITLQPTPERTSPIREP